MPPYVSGEPTGVLLESDQEIATLKASTRGIKPKERDYDIVWKNVFLHFHFHAAAVYGLYLGFAAAKWQTLVLALVLHLCGGFGITAGVHRLWSHRSYKAKWPLRLILMVFQTLDLQEPVINWARNHRVHHKFSETEADPHNVNRGFFFSHVGWQLVRKDPMVTEKSKSIDMSDLYADPILAFQHKYYYPFLIPVIFLLMPISIPMYFWGESFLVAYHINMLRFIVTLHCTFLVASVAHLWGMRPYEKMIGAAEAPFVAFAALGEGWHNFHHTFPWDYKTSELGKYNLNYTNAFIDFFAWIGWAYDLKTVSGEMVRKRVVRTGDGTHAIWGWGDEDQTEEELKDAVITHRRED